MLRITGHDIRVLEDVHNKEDFDEVLKKKGIKQACELNVIHRGYSFATVHGYNHEQKEQILNLILELIHTIPKLDTSKTDFVFGLEKRICRLAQYDAHHLNPHFTVAEAHELSSFLHQQILPYYELFEFLLDDNPDFILNCTVYEPISRLSQHLLSSGIQTNVDEVPILKDFVGERMPKEEKKDPKKK